MSKQDALKNGTKLCVCQRSVGRVASLSLAELSFKITFPSPAVDGISLQHLFLPTFYCTKPTLSLTQLLLMELNVTRTLFELD